MSRFREPATRQQPATNQLTSDRAEALGEGREELLKSNQVVVIECVAHLVIVSSSLIVNRFEKHFRKTIFNLASKKSGTQNCLRFKMSADPQLEG